MHARFNNKYFKLIVATMLFPSLLHAAELQKTKTFNCNYDLAATTGIQENGFSVNIKKQDTFSLIFDSVDVKTSRARLIGNLGGEDVHVISGAGIITFIEMTAVGNVNITSIYQQQDKEGNYLSSHSRHVQIAGGIGEAVPSQWYGTCKALLE